MQANIASNDLTLKVINQTLQYVVKTPLVILVPNSDDINDHRSEFSKKIAPSVPYIFSLFFDIKWSKLNRKNVYLDEPIVHLAQ